MTNLYCSFCTRFLRMPPTGLYLTQFSSLLLYFQSRGRENLFPYYWKGSFDLLRSFQASPSCCYLLYLPYSKFYYYHITFLYPVFCMKNNWLKKSVSKLIHWHSYSHSWEWTEVVENVTWDPGWYSETVFHIGMDRNFVCLWRNCRSQVIDLSLSALISWFMKFIIGFLNSFNLHTIISTLIKINLLWI